MLKQPDEVLAQVLEQQVLKQPDEVLAQVLEQCFRHDFSKLKAHRRCCRRQNFCACGKKMGESQKYPDLVAGRGDVQGDAEASRPGRLLC